VIECFKQERFGNEKREDIESAAAFVLYKDGKLNESLQLYKRLISRGKTGNLNEAKTLCAHVLLELSKPEEAIEMISSAAPSSRTAYLTAKIFKVHKAQKKKILALTFFGSRNKSGKNASIVLTR
jgi:outer membrane PBP1 activator LpoA protein